jgi:hypothetical protein
MALSYKQFCRKFNPNTLFVRKFSTDHTHNGFKYNLGLNMDFHPFNPSGTCKGGGLYFTTMPHINNFRCFGPKIGVLELYPDAQFYCEPSANKYKTNKIIVKQIYNDYIDFLTNFPQTEEICENVVKENGLLLQYVINQTPRICELAVRENGGALKYVKQQTPELCKIAINCNAFAFAYVKKHTFELYELAIRKDARASQFIYIS